MKSLRAGEVIREMIAINCRFGKSALYISNFGIMIENSKGAVLVLDYSSILSLQPVDKKTIKVIWTENENTYDFVFSYENLADLTAKYKAAHEDYLNLLKNIGIRIRRQTEQIIVKNPVLGQADPEKRIEHVEQSAQTL
jgi:hypothetical protein